MGKLNGVKTKTSNISSAADPNFTAKTGNHAQSSILRSSFAPSRFQLSLFASVIQGLDSEHLRIHDTHTGQLRCNHAIGPSASVTCVDWGYHGRKKPHDSSLEGGKKRKRSVYAQVTGEVVVAFGTSRSEIYLYSPAEAKIVNVLKDGHTHGIKDFKFAHDGLEHQAWSAGGDSRLVQWNIKNNTQTRLVRSIPQFAYS